MAKVFTTIAVSLDGYIAAESGDLSWINENMIKGEDYGLAKFMERAGVLIMGRNTYRQMLEQGMAGGNDTEPRYVVTHESDLKKGTQTEFYEGDLKILIDTAKTRAVNKDVCVWGGGNLITQFINLNLLDELNVSIIPVLLGGGTPLFGKIPQSKSVTLVECKKFEKSGIVILKYTF